MIPAWKIYPRSQSKDTVYLKNVIKDPTIKVGDYTYYDDFENDPRDFQKNNVLYHYPECNPERLVIGKFCSIGCGAKFIFNSANHDMNSLCNFPFPVFFSLFGGKWAKAARSTYDLTPHKGNTIIGNDVWIGYDAIIRAGVTIGDGAIIGTRALVTKDVEPYTIVGGIPAKPIRKRFDDETIAELERIRWWDWDEEKIKRNISALRSGDLDALSLL